MRSDLITLSVASKISGKSVQRLKRWVKGGRLTDLRHEGDLRSPVVIRRSELEAVVSTVAPGMIDDGDGLNGKALDVLRTQMKAFEMMIEELREDKRRLLEENRRLREQLAVLG